MQQQQIRVNGRIRAREVRVILGATNEQLGVMKIQDALRRAQSIGLDLVEVAPGANPPVCKIVDFGKYRYDLSKQDKDRKSSGSKLKEIKFRGNIDPHDYMMKVRHAEEFLDKGNKVKAQLQFRGHELSHKELGYQLMPRLADDCATMVQAVRQRLAKAPGDVVPGVAVLLDDCAQQRCIVGLLAGNLRRGA